MGRDSCDAHVSRRGRRHEHADRSLYGGGTSAWAPGGLRRVGDLLETLDALSLERPVLDPIDGGPRESQTRAVIETDDLLMVVCPVETATPVHASWHALNLSIGPVQDRGGLPTLPGYDPGRSLTRPGGPFVMLGHVTVGLRDAPDAGQSEHDFAWINRYAVEAYQAELDLDVSFPGADPIAGHADRRPA